MKNRRNPCIMYVSALEGVFFSFLDVLALGVDFFDEKQPYCSVLIDDRCRIKHFVFVFSISSRILMTGS